jgi:hypothetical protein
MGDQSSAGVAAHDNRGQPDNREIPMFADGAPGRETQWRPESKDALYQMLFEELEQRDLKKTPEYRNVMLRADQHAEWLAGLSRLSSPDHRGKRRSSPR